MKHEGQRTVVSDVWGELQPLLDIGAFECRLLDQGCPFVAGNYNRARVYFSTTRKKWTPLVYTVEGKKVGDNNYTYTLAADVIGHFAKVWSVTSNLPLEMRCRENYKGFLTQTSNFECKEGDLATLEAYYPFKFTSQGQWMEIDSPDGKGVYSMDEKEPGDSMTSVIRFYFGRQVLYDAKRDLSETELFQILFVGFFRGW